MLKIISLIFLLTLCLFAINNNASFSSDKEEKQEEQEEAERIQNYKLVAIYLIENEPRALIKNLNDPEKTATEYKEGDFIDELGVLLISKISFNPTARVELTDQDGLSYLIKPHSIDIKGLPRTPKSTFSTKTVPSYFSGGNTQSKTKGSKSKEQEASKEMTDGKATTATTETTPKKDEQSTTSDAVQEDSKKDGTLIPTQKTEPTPSADTSTPAPAERTDQLDVDRPANPFE